MSKFTKMTELISRIILGEEPKVVKPRRKRKYKRRVKK
jgi:hypothetical protein